MKKRRKVPSNPPPKPCKDCLFWDEDRCCTHHTCRRDRTPLKKRVVLGKGYPFFMGNRMMLLVRRNDMGPGAQIVELKHRGKIGAYKKIQLVAEFPDTRKR
jgi:hypothetical protein